MSQNAIQLHGRQSSHSVEVRGERWTCSAFNCGRSTVTLSGGLVTGRAKHGGAVHAFAIPIEDLMRAYIAQAPAVALEAMAKLIQERRG